MECSPARHTGDSPTVSSGSVTRSARTALSVLERASMGEGAALVERGGIVGRRRRHLALDAVALTLGVVARAEAQVLGARVVPPLPRVVGDAEDHRMADLWGEERHAHQL